jgi:hypothetical protein
MARDWYFQRNGLSEHLLMNQFQEAFVLSPKGSGS